MTAEWAQLCAEKAEPLRRWCIGGAVLLFFKIDSLIGAERIFQQFRRAAGKHAACLIIALQAPQMPAKKFFRQRLSKLFQQSQNVCLPGQPI